MTEHVVDVEVTNHGSLYTFLPLTDLARDWLAKNIGDDALWYGPCLAVEHRYAWDLAEGMAADGLRAI